MAFWVKQFIRRPYEPHYWYDGSNVFTIYLARSPYSSMRNQVPSEPTVEGPAEGYSGGQVRDSGGWARTWYDSASRILGSLSHAHLRIVVAPRRAVELKKMVVGWTADGEPPPSDIK